jgi:hypothetical protein
MCEPANIPLAHGSWNVECGGSGSYSHEIQSNGIADEHILVNLRAATGEGFTHRTGPPAEADLSRLAKKDPYGY